MSRPTLRPRFDPTKVAAVVFDIGGVFLYPHYRAVEAKLVELVIDRPSHVGAYRRAHHAGVLALTAAALDDRRPVDEASGAFWAHYDRAYATSLGAPSQHHDALQVAMRQAWDWRHDANVAAFHRLAAADVPVAIVSNNDGTAADQMRDHGVCQVGPGPLPSVAAIVDSGIEGVSKPDPAIFSPALDALDVEPARVLYVGDTVHADVNGATSAGMQVVQLDPFDHHAHFGHPRAVDVDELATAIGA